MKNIRKLLFVAVIVMALLTVLGLANRPAAPVRASTTLELQAPRFVNETRTGTAAAASIIEDEAGISAYFQASGPIEINQDLRSLFRTIETETADYIIGSIPVPDYTETDDVHVYVHTDGWALAYYLAADPTGKILDWQNYDVNISAIPTKFENILATVAAVLGVSSPTIDFYDFRYPNATHLMLIAEYRSGEGSDSFEINLPGSFTYYERSWSLESETNTFYCRGKGYYYVDDALIQTNTCGWVSSQGTLTASQLLPDSNHTLKVAVSDSGDAMGGLALIYRVP